MPTLGVFTQATSPDEDKNNVFGRIIAGVMRGNAMVQGQTQAKKIASDQMDAPSPVVTMKANPNGGPPLVTVKDITADQLNPGQQQSDLQNAYDTPHANVEKKLDDMGIGSFQTGALQSVGYTPHPTNATAADVQSFPGAYRAQREMGEGIFASAVKGLATKTGLFNQARVADELNRTEALKNAQAFKATVTPTVEAETGLMSAGNAAARLQFEGQRARIADAKEQRTEFNDVVNKIDYGSVSFSNWRKETEDALGHPISDSDFAKVQDKANRDVNSRLDAFLGKGNPASRDALGSYATFDDAKLAYGGDVPPNRMRQFQQTWAAARHDYQLKDQRTRELIDAQRTKRDTMNDREAQADDVAESIVKGDQPPDLSRLYGMAGLVRAKLAQKGYNLTAATEDWQATQTYIKSLNSTQQVRLRQAIVNTSDSLDVIEDLAKQWKAGGFNVLNKARLEAAKQGTLGQKAQSLATRLDAQINDVTAELGNVYMGGNSPTDHALDLAKANLSANWSEKTLTDAINQARTNLAIRRNSITHAGVAGGSANNQYAPKPPAPKPVKPSDFKSMKNSDLFNLLLQSGQ